jgi:hypothetical protein
LPLIFQVKMPWDYIIILDPSKVIGSDEEKAAAF